ncbi:MAG: extracellular solute-binding protein [Oscillospiraceae bacterium]|nr:extracellular solute-binding protein [Oscillospiraceae bacterium]
MLKEQKGTGIINNMKKLSIILAILILVSTLFASCANDTKPSGNKSNGTNEQSTDTGDGKYYGFDPLPALEDANGYVFKAYTRGRESGYVDWYTMDFTADGDENEIINESVYRRNGILSEKYGITLESVVSPKNQRELAEASINAGDQSFDMIIAEGKSVAAMAQGGYCVDLKTLPYLQLDGPWWDQHANEQLSIGGKLFCTTGDLSMSDNDATWICVYNKNVWEENNIENLYQLVRDNKWTIEKVEEISKQMKKDVNDDGKMDINDSYGYVFEPFNTYALFYSLGESVTKKNADDYPELSVYSSSSAEVYDIIMDMVKSRDTYYIGWSRDCTSVVKDDRALLASSTLWTIRNLYTSFDQDFGLLPMPKRYADQPYVEVVDASTCASLYAIPTSNVNTDVTAYALEALCRESKDTLRKAYYDTAIEHKTMRDVESGEMLDIILANRCFDLSMIYNWGGWYDMFCSMWTSSSSNFSSEYDTRKDQSINAIQGTIDEYIKNN